MSQCRAVPEGSPVQFRRAVDGHRTKRKAVRKGILIDISDTCRQGDAGQIGMIKSAKADLFESVGQRDRCNMIVVKRIRVNFLDGLACDRRWN